MTNISYRQVRHPEGDNSDTGLLLQRTAKARPSRRAKASSYEIHPKQRPVPEILAQPSRERTETTIRLRVRRQLPTPEAWWVPLPARASDGENENEVSVNHRQPKNMGDRGRDRREWMKRLRPMPHRRY
ncbi:hypothetical protein POX_c04628 [Penicillium oxalicum]|uniref:uncharacterized protein n=1 Tax=Penicillium oxalicum TaxID=69781 RepID=UPI0020B88C75|nr:uncharacterized protein POX_u09920 [Penicillium oxalicum]XP_049971047.1 hypothetical protein POX_c04628 [Penicillium oxalicum]KAI2785618.1 hypothetical protein POX_u09920 [Penicillium oxalicum]KAI2791750.1 hypothetical protein POX_c04628 [Penicillium oxalicum]